MGNIDNLIDLELPYLLWPIMELTWTVSRCLHLLWPIIQLSQKSGNVPTCSQSKLPPLISAVISNRYHRHLLSYQIAATCCHTKSPPPPPTVIPNRNSISLRNNTPPSHHRTDPLRRSEIKTDVNPIRHDINLTLMLGD